MASLQCEKGLGQGYYGGSSSWGSESNKYQNGYSMSYSEHERHTAHEYGKSHGTHGNAMSKPQFHAHAHGYMNAQAQAYGSNHQASPGYGYGHGNHGTNSHGKFTNHGTPHGYGSNLSGHGNGFMKPQTYGGHGGNMAYGMAETETCEYRSEVYYSNESHYNSGGRGGHRAGKGKHPVKGLLGKIKNSLSGDDSCSDSGSDSDDDGHRKRTVYVSKAL